MQNSVWHSVTKLLLGCLILFTACEKEAASCVEGRGDQVSEERSLTSFRHLYVEGRINVDLVPDSIDRVIVTYGENAVGGILTEQSGDTLNITEINSCEWIRKIDPLPLVEVHYTTMNSIFSQSAALVNFPVPFTKDSLQVQIQDAAGDFDLRADCEHISFIIHTGATDVRMQGRTDQLYLYNSGYAHVEARGLTTRRAVIHNNSTGDSYIYAEEEVFTQIYLVGNIYVAGDPSITRWHEEGGGKVIRIER